MTTKARIVRIGNSRGIRVPKLLLDQAALPEEVELRAEPGRIVVSAASSHCHRRTDDNRRPGISVANPM